MARKQYIFNRRIDVTVSIWEFESQREGSNPLFVSTVSSFNGQDGGLRIRG